MGRDRGKGKGGGRGRGGGKIYIENEEEMAIQDRNRREQQVNRAKRRGIDSDDDSDEVEGETQDLEQVNILLLIIFFAEQLILLQNLRIRTQQTVYLHLSENLVLSMSWKSNQVSMLKMAIKKTTRIMSSQSRLTRIGKKILLLLIIQQIQSLT